MCARERGQHLCAYWLLVGGRLWKLIEGGSNSWNVHAPKRSSSLSAHDVSERSFPWQLRNSNVRTVVSREGGDAGHGGLISGQTCQESRPSKNSNAVYNGLRKFSFLGTRALMASHRPRSTAD